MDVKTRRTMLSQLYLIIRKNHIHNYFELTRFLKSHDKRNLLPAVPLLNPAMFVVASTSVPLHSTKISIESAHTSDDI